MSAALARPALRSRRTLLDRMIATNFFYFVQRVFATVSPADEYIDNWYVKAMCHALMQVGDGHVRRLLVTLPPRYLKSICGSVAFAAWRLAKNPQLRILDISYGDTLSAERTMMFRQVIESDWYRRIFPHVTFTEINSDVIRTSAGGFRRARSMKGGITGLGADLIIVDDVMKAQNISNATERESVELNFRRAILSRLNNKRTGAVVVLGQRLHDDDLPGFLMRSERYRHLCLPAIAEEDATFEVGDGETYTRRKGEVLSPEREPRETLDEIRAEQGAGVFEAQYQQNPGASEGGLIQWHDIPTYDVAPDRASLEQVVISWDTGNTPKPTSDFSVGTVWGFANEKWYLLHIYRGQWDFPALASMARSSAMEWRARYVVIENCGSGISLVQLLHQEARHQAPWAQTAGCLVRSMQPRLDKPTRFAAQTERLLSGRFLFPASALWIPDLRREVLSFPDFHRNDDQVDSITQFLEWVSQTGEGQRIERGRTRPPGRTRVRSG